MDPTFTLVGAMMLVLSIILSPLSSRVGMPVLLIFLAVGMVMGEDGPGGIRFDDFELAFVIANLALARGFRVVVRPHPKGFDELWSGIRGQRGVVFDAEGGFEDFLEKWRPAFLASWFSTTLLDGLHAGAVPITLARSTDRLVLAIEEIALSWPEEAARIETCMRDDAERDRVYSKKYSAI